LRHLEDLAVGGRKAPDRQPDRVGFPQGGTERDRGLPATELVPDALDLARLSTALADSPVVEASTLNPASWNRDQLEACRGEVEAQVKAGLSVVKIGVLLERRGVVVPDRTLHRFCVERRGFGRTAARSFTRSSVSSPHRRPVSMSVSMRLDHSDPVALRTC
jgi:hypothetical protein